MAVKASPIYTVNLESNMPSSDFALKNLDMAISTAKSRNYPIIKLIHGYGSTGTGGKIKSSVHKKLTSYASSGKIKGFIKGEEFSPFEQPTQKWLLSFPTLTSDTDYLKCNHGITVVIVK